MEQPQNEEQQKEGVNTQTAENAAEENGRSRQKVVVAESSESVDTKVLNPFIAQGTSGSVNVTLSGLMGPNAWVIYSPDGAIYTSNNTGGWSVSANDSPPTSVTVSVPTNALDGVHQIHWRGLPSGLYYQRYNSTFLVP